ncbi:S-layer homology domain-containing protein [Cohnella xylanilytica]|uniref:S-layer homology domain-containing protein n=1 Tax=Cohnella xylanilytica TaxID=557555 RepID=A0A841U0D2_9BACL|nr:S-layer homology domain-containing protein [Cohnella xylanilytica]MBB6693269.1 S-layer homology domain-containing protein [Cohnella xylanilytica]
MRDSSYKSSKHAKLQIPVQGGEKKVMKKSLSLLLALAMVFGMFASMASAADTALTTEQKLQQLVDLKILKGKPDGKPHLEDNLTRAEFATIAIAVAGVAEDTTTASAFSDVKAGEWHTGAITAANKAGFVEGVGGGLFAPKATITVQEIVKVAAAIAKLTPVEGATVDGAAAWAAPYIKAAQDAGLPVPTNYTANATRGQTIDLAYAVYQALQVKPLSDAKAVVNADDTITVTGKTAGGVDSVKVAIGTAEAAAATLNADGTFTYTTAKQAVGDYKLTVTAYKGTASLASTELSAKIDGFGVSSVSVLNLKQVEVKFNKGVKKGDAEGGHAYGLGEGQDPTKSYFKLNGIAPKRASISDDQTTVTLTFDLSDARISGLKDHYANFEVSSDLKSVSGSSLSSYKKEVYISDSTKASVTGTTFEGTIAKISFSEPLKDEGVVSLNGTELPYGDFAYEAVKDAEGDVTAIKITKGLEKDASYDLDIVGATDLNDNLTDYSATLKVPNDTTNPTITSVTSNGGIVSVKFSEALAPQDADDENDADAIRATLTVDGEPQTQTEYNKDTYTLKFDLSDILGENSFKTVTFKVSKFFDLVRNEGTTVTKTLTLSKDTTKPTLSSTTVSGQTVYAKFSEDLADTVPTSVKITYTATNGVVTPEKTLTDFEFAIGYDVNANDNKDKSYAVLKIKDTDYVGSNEKLKAGKYTVKVAGLTDVAGNATNPSSVSLSFTVNSSTNSGSLKLGYDADDETPVAQDPDNNNKLELHFNGELTLEQLVAKNFLINGTTIPSDSKIEFITNRKTVVITLPEGTIKTTGKRTIKVANLVDADGNTLSGTSGDISKTIELTENVAPKAKSATLLSDTQVKVTFSEDVTTASDDLAASGVEVYINGNKADSANYELVSTGNSDVVIQSTEGSVFKTSQQIVIKFVSADDLIQDKNGNTVKVDTEITVK